MARDAERGGHKRSATQEESPVAFAGGAFSAILQ
jgi:hypothetical protein